MKKLHSLKLTHHFHTLGDTFYCEHQPQGLQEPQRVRSNPAVARQLGLDPAECDTDYFLQVFSGNALLSGSRPLAQAYAGHQFGTFNPFLGDGRNVLLGEVPTPTGPLDICLKGAGRTPYARNADGRAGLDECLHEYALSEQLAELGIPTARCLCVTQGKGLVYRQGYGPEAMLTRVAPTHIRFGTFENCYFQRNTTALRQLADHVITHHYPECWQGSTNRYACLFRAVVLRTARLIAQWQQAGFTHGMMNTDNQSIVGITLDLGSAAFNPDRNPAFVSSRADEHGRYAFGRQPEVGLWNCNVLAKALSPLIPASELRAALLCYEPEYLRLSAASTE